MIFRNSPHLINREVFSFGFSFKGILLLLIMALFVTVLLFIEFGTIVLIAHHTYFYKQIYIGDAIKTAFLKLPKLFGLGFFQMLFLLLFVFPWIDEETIPAFIDVNRTILITNVFHKSLIVKLLYLSIFLIAIYVFIRFIYTLHFIFLHNTSVWKAMKNSWRLTKRYQNKIITYLLVLNIVIFLIGFILIYLIGNVQGVLQSKIIKDFIGNYLVEGASFVSLIISLVLFPLNMIVLTRLFYHFLPEHQQIIPNIRQSTLIKTLEMKIEQSLAKKHLTRKIIFIFILSVMFMINYIVSDAVVHLPWDVKVAAHRGDGFHSPENSMSGIQSAVEKGVDTIEIDVAMTKDQVMVLSHDEDLMRVANCPERIQDLTYKELQKIDIGRSFDESFAGETIPTLAEVLDFIAETDTEVIIDVKVEDEDVEDFAKEIIELVNVFRVKDQTLVQSFNHYFIEVFRMLDPNIRLGQILYMSAGDLSVLDVDFYTIRQTMLTERFIKQAHKENRDVWVWTVNHPGNIREVLNYNIDGIITDYPERVYQLIN